MERNIFSIDILLAVVRTEYSLGKELLEVCYEEERILPIS